MLTIRKALITEFGDESKVVVVDEDIPAPTAKEVQVRVEFSGFSGADINMRRGTYPFQKKAPLTPGYCFVGRVQANGSGCSRFQQGDPVAGLSIYGAEAELINQPERYLVPVPPGLDPKQATALVLDWNTAYGMVMHAAHVKAGQMVFVHGLSGAVMQSGGGVDVVFDALGFESYDESYSILRQGGRLVAYGLNLPALLGTPPRPVLPAVIKLLARNLAFWSGKKTIFYYITRDAKTFEPDLETLFDLAKSGKISVPIKAIYSLENIQDAHREWGKASGMGSILIEVQK